MTIGRVARVAAATVLCGVVGAAVQAHHAMEYIEMESYHTARKGEFVYHFHYDYMVDDRDNADLDHWEVTPGVSYGITERLMFDIHTHFAKFGVDHVVEERREEFAPDGPSPFIEAVAASLQQRITEGGPVNVAVVGTMEVPTDRAEELLGSEDLVFAGMVILGKEFEGHRNITLNAGYEVEGDEDVFHWALGGKTPLSSDQHGIAAGIELLIQFEEIEDNWSVLPGLYLPLGAPNITLKNGIEFGKADGADAMRLNVTFMYRF